MVYKRAWTTAADKVNGQRVIKDRESFAKQWALQQIQGNMLGGANPRDIDSLIERGRGVFDNSNPKGSIGR